jgi:hypothetical protein
MTKVLIYSVLIVLLVVGFILKWGSPFAIIPKKDAEANKNVEIARKMGWVLYYIKTLAPVVIFLLACAAYLLYIVFAE